MSYLWTEKTNNAISDIAEELARDFDLDLDDFQYP
jgi:hypothetical protein